MARCSGSTLIASAMIFCSALSCYGQTATATLRVLVADSSGGAVPDAALKLTQTAKGIAHAAISNTAGQYTFSFLDPGSYTLEVKASGFSPYTQSGILLEVGQSSIVNVPLQVGAVSEAVTVVASAVQLETASGALGAVIDHRTVDDLPLNGRNPYQLAQLNSSVTATPSSRSANPTLAGAVAVSVNGGRSLQNEVLLDGSPINGRADNWPALSPSPDSVQEFRIQSSSYSAEYGRAGGGTLNFVTRSGTNQFHGTLWEFARNDALDANSFFANRQGAGKGKLRFNQFGGNFGGPILKNRLFFFGNFEALRIESGVLRQSTVPTARMKSGDFSELRGAIYFPNSDGTRTPFAGNLIPAQLQNAVGRNILSYYPDPNRPGFVNNYAIFSPTSTTNRQLVTRLDYQISSRQNIFFRLTRDWDIATSEGNFPGSIASTTAEGTTTDDPLALTLDYVNTLSPHMILHLTAGASRHTLVRTQPSSGFDLTTLGLPSYLATASGEGQVFPTIGPAGYATLGPLKVYGVTDTYQNNFPFGGDLTVLKGAHAIKVGASYRVYQVNNFRSNDPAGNFSFTRGFTARTPTDAASGDAIASLLLGLPSAGDIGIVPRLAAQNAYIGAYFQDDWTISPKLTVNLGLRWDSDLPTTERFNRLTNFDMGAAFPVSPSIVFPEALNLAPRTGQLTGALQFLGRAGNSDRGLSNADLNNFAPRFGIAYKLTNATVIRGGAGLFYSPMMGGGISPGVLGMIGESIETTYIASLDNGVTPAPGFSLSSPFPNGIQSPPGASQGALTAYGNANVQSRLRDLRNPYVGQWNLNIQRELPAGMIAEIAYSGSAGIGLLGGNLDLNEISPEVRALGPSALSTQIANPFLRLPADQRPPASTAIGRPTVSVAQLLRPYPQFGIVTALFQNTAHSTYHALQTRLERRFSANLYFRFSYTFSKMIDDISAISSNNGTQVADVQDANNRRLDKSLSTFDAGHRFAGNIGYALPFGRGKAFWNRAGAVDWFFGGWNLNAIITAQSGFPLAMSATAPAGQLGLSARTLRPNIVGDAAGTGGATDQKIRAWFNTAAFGQPASFQIGNGPRTMPDVRGPGYLGTDIAIHKNFAIRENMRFQLRLEAFNAFNRVNFTIPGTVFGNPGFGVISGTEDARSLQIAAKFYF